MIHLDATTKSLEVKLGGAVTTNQLTFVSSYVDINQSTIAVSGMKEQDGVTNNSTAVTVVTAPGATTTRQIKYLTVQNTDTVSQTVTIQYNNNGTVRPIVVQSLTTGQTLVYDEANGWSIACSSGGGSFLPLSGGTLTGDLLFTDASFDIGKTGATRPRDLFLSRNLVVGGAITVPTAMTTTTATGVQNDFNLPSSFTYLRCTGAAPVFSGFTVAGTTPSPGDRVLLECLGTTLRVLTQDTGSTTTNRVIGPSTSGQIVGVNGRIEAEYDGTTGRWRMQCIEPGAWITPAFSAGNFTGNASMTWTVDAGDVVQQQFRQSGTYVIWAYDISTSSVGGTPSVQLRQTLPFSWNLPVTTSFVGITSNNGGALTAALHLSSSTFVYAYVDLTAGTNYSAATNTTRVTGTAFFQIP